MRPINNDYSRGRRRPWVIVNYRANLQLVISYPGSVITHSNVVSSCGCRRIGNLCSSSLATIIIRFKQLYIRAVEIKVGVSEAVIIARCRINGVSLSSDQTNFEKVVIIADFDLATSERPINNDYPRGRRRPWVIVIDNQSSKTICSVITNARKDIACLILNDTGANVNVITGARIQILCRIERYL